MSRRSGFSLCHLRSGFSLSSHLVSLSHLRSVSPKSHAASLLKSMSRRSSTEGVSGPGSVLSRSSSTTIMYSNSNGGVAEKVQLLQKKLGEGEFSVLQEIRKTVLALAAPPQLLPSIGINPQFITFTNVTMESKKYICVRETAPHNSVVIIDMSIPMQPLRRPITADSTLMNPNSRTLTLKGNIRFGGCGILNLTFREKASMLFLVHKPSWSAGTSTIFYSEMMVAFFMLILVLFWAGTQSPFHHL